MSSTQGLSTPPPVVLCLGHSFTVRLSHWCQQQGKHNLGLDPKCQSVHFHGKGGKLVSQLHLDIPAVVSLHPQLVCIDIATNDLDSQAVQPHVLARQVFHFAQLLVSQHNVSAVVIMEVLFRTQTGKFGTTSQNKFTLAANKYNNVIKSLVSSHPAQARQVHFWHHKGLVKQWEQYIKDGVHLNSTGMAKYFTSYRRCIIRHSNKLVR